MFRRHHFFIFALFLFVADMASAQSPASSIRFTIVPLTVDQGFPLQVALTDKVHLKLHERVHARVIEPVYAFDREVIPVGTEVVGTITGFRSNKLKRLASILTADFTPVRSPLINFDTLVLEDGTRVPIETSLAPGVDTLVRFNGDDKQPTKVFANAVKPPGKDLLKGVLWGLSPYRPQSVPAGLHFKATLLRPLELGNATVRIGALDRIGSAPPAGSVIYARLETPVNSRTTKLGAPVTALLTVPLFSWDHLLTFPVGSRLLGEVEHVRPAGPLKRTGELGFKFTRIEPPISISMLSGSWTPQDVDGQLIGVQVANEVNRLRIDQEGTTRVAQSKERFIAPAFALFNLRGGLNTSSESFTHALTGAYTSSLFRQVLVGNSGLGVPAGIAGRMIPPVGIGLGLFSAGRSVFFNILARGQEINFPADTPIEVRVEHQN